MKQFFLNIGRKTFLPVIQKSIVRKIIRKKDPNTLIILSTTAMGDLLHCLAFLKEIKQKNPSKKIVVVTREKFKYILDTYDSYDDAILIRQSQRLALFQLRCLKANFGFCGQMFQEGIVFEARGILSVIPDFLENKTNYIEGICKAFDLGSPPRFHQILPAKVTSIPNFSEICKRCVVLNPYSTTMQLGNVGTLFLERVCDNLKKKGYIVYTNVVGDQIPVPGSIPLHCSLEEMLGIASKIPFVISLRSGFCDFLIPSGVNMFVIYNKQWFYIWFLLKAWGGQGKLEEIYYEKSAGEAEVRRLEDAFNIYLAEIEQTNE